MHQLTWNTLPSTTQGDPTQLGQHDPSFTSIVWLDGQVR